MEGKKSHQAEQFLKENNRLQVCKPFHVFFIHFTILLNISFVNFFIFLYYAYICKSILKITDCQILIVINLLNNKILYK